MLSGLLAKGDPVETVALGGLVAQLDRSAHSLLRIRLAGRSASREAHKVLEPLFQRILDEAKAESRSLELHFESLEYFNSSTIAALVRFIRVAHEDCIPLTVVYDARQPWQAMSFEALRRALGRPGGSAGDQAVRFCEA